MKYPIIISAFLTLAFGSCKKKDPDLPYSHWRVNADSFNTNNVSKNIDQLRHLYEFSGGNDLSNTFYMDFGAVGNFPESGNYPLNISGYPYKIVFYYNNQSYLPSQFAGSSIAALKLNGQIHYVVPPTWFYKWQDHSDSALINGDFVLL